MIAKILLVIAFVAVAVAVGIYCRRHTGTVDGFILGGRNVGPWMSAFAYGTSYFSAVVFVGYAGQFGFKYGIPPESDLVFDVRFLPNPYYEMSLRERNGTDPEVRDYVFQGGTADVLMRHLTTLIDFLLPRYMAEGKANLIISVGCTGGKHRSVAIAKRSASICAAVNTALSPCIEIIRDRAPVCGAPQKWSQNTCHFLPKSKTSCAAFP